MCIYSKLSPKLEGLDLGLLHWANIQLKSVRKKECLWCEEGITRFLQSIPPWSYSRIAPQQVGMDRMEPWPLEKKSHFII